MLVMKAMKRRESYRRWLASASEMKAWRRRKGSKSVAAKWRRSAARKRNEISGENGWRTQWRNNGNGGGISA